MLRVGSDLAAWPDGRQWVGLLNVIALLVFMGNTALAMLAGKRAMVRTRASNTQRVASSE